METHPGVILVICGSILGVFLEPRGVLLGETRNPFFESRPGGGPGPYFALKTLCFTRVIFRNSHFVREWSQSEPKKSRNRLPK